MSKPLTLTILEPEATGHRMVSTVRHVAAEAQRRGWEIHLLTTEPATRHSAYSVLLADLDGALPTSLIDHVSKGKGRNSRFELLRYQSAQWRAFRDGLAESSVARGSDVIFVSYMEYCDKMIALRGSPFGSCPFVGLSMRADFHHATCGVRGTTSRFAGIYRWFFQRLLGVPQLRSLVTIDPLLRKHAAETRMPGAEKIVHAPDPAYLRQTPAVRSRRTIGLGDDQVGILAYGSLTYRKGLDALIRALLHEQAPKNLVGILAGTASHDVSRLLASAGAERLRAEGRLLEFMGFQTDLQEGMLFAATDMVWVGYRDFSGMSGVALKAAAAGAPIIACQEGLVGWLAEEEQIGLAVDIEDTAALASALSRLAASPNVRARFGAQGKLVAKRHTPEIFASTICDALAAAATVPADPLVAR